MMLEAYDEEKQVETFFPFRSTSEIEIGEIKKICFD
jgi:hypothetical protein